MSEHDSNNAQQQSFPARDSERFDLCIGMLKAYYEALEGRAVTFAGFLVAVIGWLITSMPARTAIHNNVRLLGLGISTLTILMAAYVLNVARWLNRWREIRGYLEALHYIEPRFYARYELVKWAAPAYVLPLAVLYALICGITGFDLLGQHNLSLGDASHRQSVGI